MNKKYVSGSAQLEQRAEKRKIHQLPNEKKGTKTKHFTQARKRKMHRIRKMVSNMKGSKKQGSTKGATSKIRQL